MTMFASLRHTPYAWLESHMHVHRLTKEVRPRVEAHLSEAIQITRSHPALLLSRNGWTACRPYCSAPTWAPAQGRNGGGKRRLAFPGGHAFKGTTSAQRRCNRGRGRGVGGYINAYTAREQTAYYIKVLKENNRVGGRYHRRHTDLLHVRIAGAGTRARCDPARDRTGERYPGRHHLRSLSGNRLPVSAHRAATLGSEEGIRQMPRGTSTAHMNQHYGAGTSSWRPRAISNTARSLDLVGRHFARLRSAPPAMVNATIKARDPGKGNVISTRSICLGLSVSRLRIRGLLSDPAACRRCLGGGCPSFVRGYLARSVGSSILYILSTRRTLMAGCSASRRHRRGGGPGTRAGGAGGTSQGAVGGNRGRALPCAIAGQGEPVDVPGRTGSRCEQPARQPQVFGVSFQRRRPSRGSARSPPGYSALRRAAIPTGPDFGSSWPVTRVPRLKAVVEKLNA